MPKPKRRARAGRRPPLLARALRLLALFSAVLMAATAGLTLLLHAGRAERGTEEGDALLEGLASPHAILLDADTGAVLAQKAGGEAIYPASLTKIMTALLALEALPDLDAPCTVPEEIFPALWAADASMAGFQPGEQATVRDLLYGTLLPSGAECAVALARAAAGDEAAFVRRMNEKAAALGMAGTHFCNPTGLHAAEHVSTVSDLAILLRAALQNGAFYTAFTAASYQVPPTALHPDGFALHSTLFEALDECRLAAGAVVLGGKTGYTEDAGLCLASLAEVGGRRYLLVTAGAEGDTHGEPYHVQDACTVYSRLAG